MTCDSTPAANISPSGSKQQTGFPRVLAKPCKIKTNSSGSEELDHKGLINQTL